MADTLTLSITTTETEATAEIRLNGALVTAEIQWFENTPWRVADGGIAVDRHWDDDDQALSEARYAPLQAYTAQARLWVDTAYVYSEVVTADIPGAPTAPTPAAPQTAVIDVGPHELHATINSALEDLLEGGVIRQMPCTMVEDVVMPDGTALQGYGQVSILDGDLELEGDATAKDILITTGHTVTVGEDVYTATADTLVQDLIGATDINLMVDGITAPAATAGFAKVFVDEADGHLKIQHQTGDAVDLEGLAEVRGDAILIADGASIPTPEEGAAQVFVDSNDGHLKVQHENGAIVDLEEKRETLTDVAFVLPSNTSADNSGLHIAISLDGINFKNIKTADLDDPIWTGKATGDGVVMDPMMFEWPVAGGGREFFLLYRNAASDGIVNIARSPDLLNWTDVAEVPLADGVYGGPPGSPFLFTDANGITRILGGCADLFVNEVHTSFTNPADWADPDNWSDPAVLHDVTEETICSSGYEGAQEVVIFYGGGVYHMLYYASTGGTLYRSAATDPVDGWSVAEDWTTYIGWPLGLIRRPIILDLGDRLRLYATDDNASAISYRDLVYDSLVPALTALTPLTITGFTAITLLRGRPALITDPTLVAAIEAYF